MSQTEIKKPAPTALFDLDGTLADYDGRLALELSDIASPGEMVDESQQWYKNRLRMIKSRPGWWLALPTLKNGFDILHLARKAGFRIHILTKGPATTPAAWTEKFQWCRQYVPDADVTITEDKGLVYGRVLVDDFPDYMLGWLAWRPRGLGIMPCRKVNEGFSHPNVIKYDGTPECLNKVNEALIKAFERKDA